jgi:hypothetical protein
MDTLLKLTDDPRVTVRRSGPPDPESNCVVYWMQRSKRGCDNPALDVAVSAANALGKPVVVFLRRAPSRQRTSGTMPFSHRAFPISSKRSKSVPSDSSFAASPITACFVSVTR